VYPTSNNRPVEWNETAKESKETIRLRPGDSIKFTAEMSQLEVGDASKQRSTSPGKGSGTDRGRVSGVYFAIVR